MTTISIYRLFVLVCVTYLSSTKINAFVHPFAKKSQIGHSNNNQAITTFGNLLGSSQKPKSVAVAVESSESTEEETAVAADEEAETPEVDASDAAEKPARKKVVTRERHTVFVGNLPFDMTDTQVRDLFSEHGKVELVSVPKNRETGQSRGFAFVDMGTPEECDAVVAALDGFATGGRTLRVAKSLPKEEAKKQPRKGDSGKKKLYVGNIPFDATNEDLIEFFSEFGQVADVYIPMNRETGSPRGFAFLSLNEEAVEKAIEATNGAEFMGRKIAVSLPLPPGEKAPIRDRTPRTKLYVGNLSFYTVPDTLRALFEEFGTVHDCYMPEDPATGEARGFGFVTMDVEAANAAIYETDGCELDGRIIRVNEAQPKRDSPPPSDDDESSDSDEGSEP